MSINIPTYIGGQHQRRSNVGSILTPASKLKRASAANRGSVRTLGNHA